VLAYVGRALGPGPALSRPSILQAVKSRTGGPAQAMGP